MGLECRVQFFPHKTIRTPFLNAFSSRYFPYTKRLFLLRIVEFHPEYKSIQKTSKLDKKYSELFHLGVIL